MNILTEQAPILISFTPISINFKNNFLVDRTKVLLSININKI